MSALTSPNLLLLCGFALIFFPGCDRETETEDEFAGDEQINVTDSRFGDPYEIVTQEYTSSHDVPPGLTDDSLFVTAGYTGGCADHSFTLHHEAAQDTTRLWLHHDAPRDECNDYIYHDLALPTPFDIDESSTVLLLNPQGYEPHVLRWGIAG